MQTYIGTKIIKATPISRADYNTYRGWTLPADENGEDTGFLVEYVDGGKANDSRHEGYISWSPTEVFNNAYRPMQGMTFGFAIESLRKGLKVCRAGWNGKGMWIVMMPSLYLPPFNTADELRKINDRTAKHIGEDKPLDSQPYFAMWTAQGKWQPGWLASQSDMLAEDWEILD